MSRDVIRVGIVGLGFGAAVHGPVFASLDGCRLVAIAGQSDRKAEAAAAALGGIKAFSGWRAMLDGVELEAISIAVPPGLQPAIVSEAAARGLAVFCEKPSAADIAGAEQMLDAVTRAGVPHAINFLFPEIPAWKAAKQRIDELARDQPLRYVVLNWHVETYAHRHHLNDGWKRNGSHGGGALNTFVSHSVYYLEWLFGPVRRVLARLTFADHDDDSRVEAWLEFDSGLAASLSVAIDCPFGAGHRLEAYGRDGSVILDNPSADYVNGFTLAASMHSPTFDPPTAASVPDGAVDGRISATAQIASRFVSHVRAGGSPTPNLGNGFRVQTILEAFRQSHHTRAWVEAPRGLV